MSQKMKTTLLQSLPAIIIATLLVGVIIYAWTEPSTSPPKGNVAAPINVSGNAQIKSGALQVNGFRNIGTTVLDGNVGIGTTGPGGYKLYVADQGRDVMFDVNNLHVANPESTGNWVRLGAAWNKPGVYSNGNLYLGSEGAVIINDNNQENWGFDGDNFWSNGWGHIYTTASNLHLDSYSGEMYLNYYYNNWVNVGNRDTGYLFIGNTQLFDNNDWLYILSGANNRIYTNSYLRIDNSLEVNGDIRAETNQWGSCVWRTPPGGTYYFTCNQGEFLAGIKYEAATWSNQTDNHSGPEIDGIYCCKL